MTPRILTISLFSLAFLLAGCEFNSPSESSANNKVDVGLQDPAGLPPGAVARNPENGMPIYDAPTNGSTVALWAPFKGDAGSIPFPTDLLFNGTKDGSINIPGVANSDSTATLNLTTQAGIMAAASPQVALNTLSGFSTTAMMVVRFSAPIKNDTANLTAGIRIFEMKGNARTGTLALKGDGSGVAQELAFGVDFIAQASGTNVAILPLRPLDSSTTYRIVVTTNLKDVNGNSVKAYGSYQAQREGNLFLFPQINVYEKGLAAYTATNPFPPKRLQGIPVALASSPLVAGAHGNIAMSYSVTTQNITAALTQAQKKVASEPAPTIAVGAIPATVNTPITTTVSAANTQIYVGAVSGMTSFLNPADPVHSIWNAKGNNLSALNAYKPTAQGKVTVPVLVTAPTSTATIDPDGPGPTPAVPCAAVYPDGLPVVIFQHGITSNRGTMLALAGALSKVCAVGVAIDLPEHGIVPASLADILAGNTANLMGFLAMAPNSTNPLAGGVSPTGPLGERLVSFGAGAPSTNNPAACMSGASIDVTGNGDYRCESGDSYINLTNLANSRDLLRQSVIGLDSLYLALKDKGIVELDPVTQQPVGTLNIDTSKISFVGISLGSIVGETFVATLASLPNSSPLTSVAFNVGGGGIAKLLDGSASIGPVIRAGLSTKISDPGTYQSFLLLAQTLVDSADPINYADELNQLKSTTPILFQEVVGGSGKNPDMVVPNNVYGPALGTLWGAISGSGQTGWLAGQSALASTLPLLLTPAALGGTDSLVQGTAFISLASAYQSALSMPTTPPFSNILACIGTNGPLCDLTQALPGNYSARLPEAFFGIGLKQLTSSSTPVVGSRLVRFNSGVHGSLLSPASDPAVTAMMQTQVATFVGTASLLGSSKAQVVGCTPSCAPVIAP